MLNVVGNAVCPVNQFDPCKFGIRVRIVRVPME